MDARAKKEQEKRTAHCQSMLTIPFPVQGEKISVKYGHTKPL